MATTRLNAGVSARCPEGRMTVDWQVAGWPQASVALDVVRTAQAGQAAAGASPLGPTQTLIAVLPEAVAILVRPTASSTTFPNDVHVSVSLTLHVGNVEAATYLLPRVDVSGTPATTLAIISPEPGFWQIDVPALLSRPAEPDEPHTPSTELTGLAHDAAFAARRSARSVRLADASEVHVAVDRSASFLPLVRDGSGQALLELMVGINEVAGSEGQIGLWALGSSPERVRPALTKRNVDGYWQTAFGNQARTGGTLIAPLVAATDAGTRPRTVVVLTDGVPADLEDVAVAVRHAHASGSSTRWHVLALARSHTDQQVRQEPWRDELRPLARLASEGLLTYSGITPSTEPGWLVELLQDPDTMHAVVDELPFWRQQ